MRKCIYTLSFVLFLASSIVYSQQLTFLYPTKKNIDSEKYPYKDVISNILSPRIEAYLPEDNIANGTAVLICPGGAYAGLTFIKEGQKIAQWFNSVGVAAFVLYYRLPNGDNKKPLSDAKKAISIIKKNAKRWSIDKDKIGVIGFSAGGHLASTVGTHIKKKSESLAFMILCYPVISMKSELAHKESRNNLIGINPTEGMINLYSNELQVTKVTPPTFILHAKDDKIVPINHSELFYEALQKEGVSVHSEFYDKGGHGFGMNKRGLPIDHWNEKLKTWLQINKFI